MRIDADFAPTLALLDRLRGGEGADVVILTREGLDDMAREGRVVADSCVDLARSYVGLAVKAGFCPSRYRNRACAARGAACRPFGGLFADRRQRHPVRAVDRAAGYCIRDQCAERASSRQGFTAERLVTGEADLAVQQISELKQVGGIEVVGPIPRELQTPAVFSAGRDGGVGQGRISRTGCCGFSPRARSRRCCARAGLSLEFACWSTQLSP